MDSGLDFSSASVPIRPALVEAMGNAWRRLPQAGTVWTGEERLAIARESRNAWDCPFCAECREALSPFAADGAHTAATNLPAPAIDAIHRVINDQGRLTQSWFRRTLDEGLNEAAYVEILGVVATIVAIDTFHRGIGLSTPELPSAVPGEPSGAISKDAEHRIAWVRTVHPMKTKGALAEHWFPGGERQFVPHVRQALSLVPAECIAYAELSGPMYLSGVADLGVPEDRALTRPQMELLATRTSALNECFY